MWHASCIKHLADSAFTFWVTGAFTYFLCFHPPHTFKRKIYSNEKPSMDLSLSLSVKVTAKSKVKENKSGTKNLLSENISNSTHQSLEC